MKTKSPGILYFLFVITGGQFAWVWLLLLMNDVNKIDKKRVFSVRIIGAALAALLLTQIFLLLRLNFQPGEPSGISDAKFNALFVLGIGLVLFLVSSLLIVERRLVHASGKKYSALLALVTVFLTLFGVSFLLIQIRANKLLNAA